MASGFIESTLRDLRTGEDDAELISYVAAPVVLAVSEMAPPVMWAWTAAALDAVTDRLGRDVHGWLSESRVLSRLLPAMTDAVNLAGSYGPAAGTSEISSSFTLPHRRPSRHAYAPR